VATNGVATDSAAADGPWRVAETASRTIAPPPEQPARSGEITIAGTRVSRRA
jgi:hypothetical protein